MMAWRISRIDATNPHPLRCIIKIGRGDAASDVVHYVVMRILWLIPITPFGLAFGVYLSWQFAKIALPVLAVVAVLGLLWRALDAAAEKGVDAPGKKRHEGHAEFTAGCRWCQDDLERAQAAEQAQLRTDHEKDLRRLHAEWCRLEAKRLGVRQN
jgi:hypothetical protein